MSTPAPENQLLAALPPDDFARLAARMTDVTLGHGEVLYRAGGPMRSVYFPRSGVLSAAVVMADGRAAEAAAVGREGMVGVAACLGAARSPERVSCQVHPAACRKMPASEFAAEVARGGPLRDVAHAHARAALAAAARQAACICLHSVGERCARWFLACRDRVGADEFSLTHASLSALLGVRRATVTESAGSLQRAGLIAYRRGRVTVLDRAGLEGAACECYRAVRDVFGRPGA
jgi:CRP-like cAMP-binding protein